MEIAPLERGSSSRAGPYQAHPSRFLGLPGLKGSAGTPASPFSPSALLTGALRAGSSHLKTVAPYQGLQVFKSAMGPQGLEGPSAERDLITLKSKDWITLKSKD